ncbi:MAG: M48 family metallopeptidase [Acetobacteraceae bacterium]|nr:M48 family metallopeptidase [Acetobacteraceae bacterium]
MDQAVSEVMALPGGEARVHWRRSARARRVSLRIDPRDGAVVVTLPPRTGRPAGMALLLDHADWVTRRLAALPGAVPLADGAAVPLVGVAHRIRHMPDRRGTAWLEDGEIRVAGDAAFLSRRVTDFLRAEARRRLSALVAEKSALCGLRASRITVKDTRTRWGSCAASRALAFSWRLVMAPGFVQDYVVAHEVAHLRHMNHGPRFWALVETLTPHTSVAMAWLRDEGPRLMRVGA